MAKIYCDINQCDASVQYFAILHAVKGIHNTKNKLTLTLYVKMSQHHATVFAKKTFLARQNHYIVRRKILAIR